MNMSKLSWVAFSGNSFLAVTVVLSCLLGDSACYAQNLGGGPGGLPQDRLPGAGGQPQVRPQGSRFTEPQTFERFDRPNVSDQPILLNSKYAGWQGTTSVPNAEGQKIGDQLRTNWIMVDRNGQITGQVTPTGDADVSNMTIFLMHMGRLVKQTRVDDQGKFQFANVRQGAYAVVGWGSKAFFAFGANILAYNPESDGKVGNHLNVSAFQNATTINTDWIQYFASGVKFRVFGRYPIGEGRDDASSLYGVKGLFNNLPQGFPATSISSHTVSRTEDDRLIGRVHQMNSINGRPVDVRTTRVMLLEGDSVVASTSTDNHGTFEFRSVPDGTYGVLAAGVDGVGLIAITVDGSETAINAEGEAAGNTDNGAIDFTMVSAETIGFLNNYATEIAYQRALRAPTQQQQQNGEGYICPHCNNQQGGCATCQGLYNQSGCRSRNMTFEQWLASGCQNQRQGFGDGYFLRETGKRLRRTIERVDNFYENAFYPNSGQGLGTNFNNGAGGYNNGYGGYNYQAPVQGYAPAQIAPPIPQGN